MGVFTEAKDVIQPKDKKSIYDQVAEELTRKPYIPKEAPIKCLFWGGDGTGKSGVALTLLDMINLEEGEKILVIDLDIGNMPASLSYHRKAYENGNLILWNPLEMKEEELAGERDFVTDYKLTMARVKAGAIWAKDNFEELKIRAVVLDGLSTLLKHSEWQMRLEKNLDVSGGVTQRYWVTRNKSFLEMLQLYKSIPLDVIFIGNSEFGVDVNDKEASKIYRNVNDLVFQKVSFKVEETVDGQVEFWGKIEKSKQNIKNRGRTVKFGEVDLNNEETDYYWDPRPLLNLMRPDPKAKNRADLGRKGDTSSEESLDGDIAEEKQ